MCGPSSLISGGDAEVQLTKWLKPSLRELSSLASGEMVTVAVEMLMPLIAKANIYRALSTC